MDDETPRVNVYKPKRKRNSIRSRLPVVILLALIYGLLMLKGFRSQIFTGDPAYLAFLVFVPVGIGALSLLSIPAEERTWRNALTMAILTGLIFLVVAVLADSGILLCVLMVVPFVSIPLLIGAGLIRLVSLVGGQGKKKKKNREYAFVGFVLLLPLLVAQVEKGIPLPDWNRSVTDDTIIHGSVEDVWQHIIRMDTILPEEQRPSFYQAMGIPRPVHATLDFEGVGATRRGEFEYGLAFNEAITTWEPLHEVRFEVSVEHNPQSSPVLKQIGGRYFDILEAGYQLEQIDSDTVRLRLSSEYRLSTHFNFYGAFWSDWIMHDFQAYVLNTVKQRVESAV